VVNIGREKAFASRFAVAGDDGRVILLRDADV
jgi:hypothetical protein